MINNIGPPFDNTSAFVLDPQSDAILPRGAVGELCFGGAQVFRGYLNRPELNSTKIIDHPQYGRIYRSGDMGIMLPDDSILSTGRSDDQIKIRGQRVELGEINSAILDHHDVRDCVTLLLSSWHCSESLVSFWVPSTSINESFEVLEVDQFQSAIRSLLLSLSRRLPSYMIPSRLIPVASLPMTAQAKVDKHLLQHVLNFVPEETTNYENGDDDHLVFSEWEEAVASILAQTLDLSRAGVHRTTSFFSLGLDSVSAIRFCNELRKASLADFAISVVLKNPTIAALAMIHEGQSSLHLQAQPSHTDLASVFSSEQIVLIESHYRSRHLPIARILPCTPLQEAMLSTADAASSSSYCNLMVFSINGDISRLQDCWRSMNLRHEILCTSFISTENSSHAFAQVILENHDMPLHTETLDGDVHERTSTRISDLLNANEPPVFLALAHECSGTKLMFCCHHTLYDGIAIAALLGEIEQLYDGKELPPPVTYDNYLQHMLSHNFVEADEHWAKTFDGFEPTFFPNLTGKLTESSRHVATATRRLELPLSKLREACQENSVSLLSVVQATWAKLLHFYTAESDICFGNIVSGRAIPGDEIDRLVAPCFNTLPVRVKFDFHLDNLALANLMHEANIDALAYHLTPLRRIQNLILKDGGRLFDTLVILQQPTASLNPDIWTLEQDLGEMDLPVVCEVFQDQHEDVLMLWLHYDTSLLSERDAAIVIETFESCLSSLVNFPQAVANDTIELPSHLRAENNVNPQPLVADDTLLHSGFEKIVASQPDLVALDFLHSDGTRTIWTFKALDEKANNIAQHLLHNSVAPEDIIPLHMRKSPTFYASILGVLKAGAAFAPVHPDLPEARKRSMLEQLNPKLMLCSEDCMIDRNDAKTIVADTIGAFSDIMPRKTNITGSSLAYCLFTSGSTGVPKAVSMEHRAPVHTIASSKTLIPWDSSSRLLQYAAVTFDMCYYDCFLAWTFGFTLCAAAQDELLNELPKAINTLKVDLLDLTPSVAISLSRSELPGVKWLYCIGEPVSRKVVEEWGGACVNSYGPTEAAFCTTITPVSSTTSTSVIGQPFPSTSFAIFPPSGDHHMPLLSVGELHIGGEQLARGYLGDPELTSKRFVTKNGQRFYKSGDLVRMLSSGDFDFVGRTDDQVKIRGLRVELGEINHTLQNCHSNVATVVTQILKKDKTGKQLLVAFVAPHTSIEETEQVAIRTEFKKSAAQQLPSYMVPQFFIFVDRMPMSMAGKLDKNALAKVFANHVEAAANENGVAEDASVHQWTSLEEKVRSIFVRLSDAASEDIAPTTTIYQLGLDSISAVQIAVALRRQGYSVNAADVMKHMTCVDIAAHLEQSKTPETSRALSFDFDAFEKKHKATISQVLDVDLESIAAIRPCTPLQQSMVAQFLATEGTVYMNYLRLKLESVVDLTKLRTAWTATTERHTMLRTGFAHVQDSMHSFAMIEHKSNAADFPWSSTTDSCEISSADDWLREVQIGALDTLHRPPWALRAVREHGCEYLDLAIFHGLFDAQSLQIMLDDVAASYGGQTLPASVSLDSAIDDILQSSQNSSQVGRDFWTQLGKDVAASRFPNLAPLRYEPVPPVVRTKRSNIPLAELEYGCREANITLQAAGLASWLSLLSAYTGETSVTCGVVLSGRNLEATEKAVLPCINTVPFACTMTKERIDVLDKVRTLNADIQEYQSIPLNEIQKLMGFRNELLFDTIFAYQKLTDDDSASDLWTVVDEKATVEYPVSIELEPKHGHLEYRLTVLPHLIPVEQADLLLDQLNHMMEYFVTPATQETDLSLDSRLYSITPAKESNLPSEVQLLHEFVEVTATQHPNRIALEFAHSIADGTYSGKSWTYAELDAEGNRIAHLLISHNASPGALVGVCFDKCPEASFAMLGILKAGCAFVAIDPGAPAARQGFIVGDSKACAVLSMSKQSAQFRDMVDVPVLDLDTVSTKSLPMTKAVLSRRIDSQDRSYCLYTSGTTGTPKGCELTHENAVQALLAFQRLFAGHWDDESRWLQFASFHFDVSVLEQFWSWSIGICVVSAPRDLIFEDLAGSISSLGITHIDLTPSLAQILHPDDVPSLCRGVFITGGESLKQEILDVWGPKSVIYNGYGPTEATIGVTMYTRVPGNGKPSNIGWQFDNVGTFVLQPGTDSPVLRGGVGELCVSGKLVGKGYLNCPELTLERFPYLERLGERVYRTGDLVRILYDGTFDFLGRADDQVKLRGQRLEVGEINSVIKQSRQDISDIATLVLKHSKQQKDQLVAFIVFGRNKSTHPKILISDASSTISAREACQEKLPPYMVPTHFVSLTSMPLNTNNKADAKQLRALYETLSSEHLQRLSTASTEQSEIWSSQEQKFRGTLSKLLDVSEDTIGKDTSFFEVGMDSISVIGLSRALKQARFSNITASLVMKHPTIRRLTNALAANGPIEGNRGSILAAQQTINAIQHRHKRTVARSLVIEPSAIEALAPCTPLQQGMIARYLESEDGLYFNTFEFKISGGVDGKKLRTAWEGAFASTQILRTVFVNTEDGYVQAVLRGTDLPWFAEATEDGRLTDRLEKLRQKWLQGNQAELRRPFEVGLVSTADEKRLVFHMFHGLYDGNSIGLIFKSVWDTCNGHDVHMQAPSFHEALAYGPLRAVEGAKDFWQKHLTAAGSTPLPSLGSTTNEKPTTVTRYLHGLTAFESTRRRLNVTAQAIAQACWLSTLQEYLKGPVTTGMIVSGRSIDLEGADRIVGPMFNTIPYHHRAQSTESWASIIKRVHEFNVVAHPYQHTPLRDIMKWCGRNSSQPLFDSLFVYQVSQDEEHWAKNDAWELMDGEIVADYPLALEIEQKAIDELKVTLVTQENVADESTANELLDRLEEALRRVLEDSESVFESSIVSGKPETDRSEDKELLINSTEETANFEWTEVANKIRAEIAGFSGTGIEDISESTSIFELGLDSIDAIKLSSKLKKHGIDLPVSGIMRNLTIAKMVQSITTESKQEDQQSLVSDLEEHKRKLRDYIIERQINLNEIEEVLPLTPLQESMLAEMMASEYTRYFNHDVLRIQPGIDVERLRRAWTEVVEASPILRTGFVEVDHVEIESTFAQMIHRKPHGFWSHVKLEDVDFSALFERLREEAMDLAISTPPFRVTLVEIPEQQYLVLSIAHALYDGWSLGLTHADVQSAYQNQIAARPNYESTLAEIMSSSGDRAADFWQDYLSNAGGSSFPRKDYESIEDVSVVHRLQQSSKIPVNELTSFAKKNNISLQTLGQTVFAMVLASYVHSLDVTFGSVLSGRDDDQRSQLLFPTMNTVAIRTILHGTCSDMLHYVQDNFLNIKQWQHFPLRKALSLAGVDGSLFESLFIYQKSLADVNDEVEKLYTSVEGHSDVEYPVCVEMEVVGEDLVWRCAVKEEVFSREGAGKLLYRLDEVLGRIMERSAAPVIEVTTGGTSVCGLPAFKERGTTIVDDVVEESTLGDDEPPTQTAQLIRQVFAAVSGTPENEITRHMTIFHMGLDSISAIKVSSLLRKRDIVLSVGEMLRAKTIDKMAQLVDMRVTKSADTNEDYRVTIKKALQGIDQNDVLARAGIDKENVADVLPLSAGQLYMLSMWLNTKGGNFYPDFQYKMMGTASFDTLQKAWQALVDANAIFRTTIVSTETQQTPYVQVVQQRVEVAVTDITGFTDEQIRESVEAGSMTQPWIHVFAAKTSTGWDLRLKIHHALYDGVSLPLLVKQYQDLCNGSTALTVNDSFAKFIAIGCTASAVKAREDFWKEYLVGADQQPATQPTTPPTTRVEVFRPSFLRTSSLELTARENGLSAQAIFLAVYAKIYAAKAATTDGEDIIIGIYLANRSLPIDNLASAAIPTLNFIPLCIRLPRSRATLDLATQIQTDLATISSPTNASTSLSDINTWTGVKVDTFVNFLSLPEDEDDADELYRSEKDVVIEPVWKWGDAVSRIAQIEHKVEVPREIMNERVNGAYLVSLYLNTVYGRIGANLMIACG